MTIIQRSIWGDGGNGAQRALQELGREWLLPSGNRLGRVSEQRSAFSPIVCDWKRTVIDCGKYKLHSNHNYWEYRGVWIMSLSILLLALIMEWISVLSEIALRSTSSLFILHAECIHDTQQGSWSTRSNSFCFTPYCPSQRPTVSVRHCYESVNSRRVSNCLWVSKCRLMMLP